MKALKKQRLKDLLKGIPGLKVTGKKDVFVESIHTDSRTITPGSLFTALPGTHHDGAHFTDQALHKGASVILSSEKPPKILGKTTHIQSENPAQTHAVIARNFHHLPDTHLDLIGVTGTNGKTTTTYLLHHLLSAVSQKPAGLLGTIENRLGPRVIPAKLTTNLAHDTASMLHQMAVNKCHAAAIEVSSIGLAQDRTYGLEFDIAVFLNLSPDHLDFHSDMDTYFAAKAKLFNGSNGSIPAASLINLDDPYGPEFLSQLSESTGVLTFGIDNKKATFNAHSIELTPQGATFTLDHPNGSLNITSPLLGRYNIYNTLAALATLWALEHPLDAAAHALTLFPGVPGRMQSISAGQDFNVLVDYAHTPDALDNALIMLKEITPGRILSVFGCGGDRDPSKRPLMVSAVQKHSDLAYATADNPRTEPQQNIFNDMKTGVTHPNNIVFITDRTAAIAAALHDAQPGDCVLIAGKGHEAFQQFADTLTPFSDPQIALGLLQNNTTEV